MSAQTSAVTEVVKGLRIARSTLLAKVRKYGLGNDSDNGTDD